MNLLVTGGAGFIGSHFVRAILADRLPGLEGATITVMDPLAYAGSFANLGPVAEDSRLDFVPGDVRDAPVVDGALRGHDAIVHFAAETGIDRTRDTAAGLSHTNVTGTQVLLDAAVRRGVARFLHVSTGRVYGPLTTGAWTERAPVNPISPYAASKAGADLAVLACHRTHGLPAVVTRAADTFGPRQHPEKLIPGTITHVLDGRPVRLPAGGATTREWLHVDDHCQALALALLDGVPGEVYNIGGTVELTDRDLVGALLDELGAGWDRVTPAPGPPPDGPRTALDDDKLRQTLGWRPSREFRPALAETVTWYRDNPTWWRPLLFD